ncbi:MAG: dihydroneopterin aldolase [Actinomycetota bacterium]|nr:dihydroneopterin aldolase [Actinomycetota bacterium]
MTDHIELRGLRLMGIHGALAEEQARPQPFEADLEVEADLAAAAATDDLSDTVDYAALVEAMARVVDSERYALLESLAERMAEVVMADDRVRAVTIAIRKLRPPVAADLQSAGVRITRARQP